jgi:putative membrane protein
MRRVWKIAALLAGLVLFGAYAARVDWGAVREAFARLGWLTPLALLPYACVYLIDCAGWRWAFATPPRVSFATLFRIRWAGEAVNNLVPSAYVGGEAVKVFLLQRHGVSGSAATAGAVISKTAQTAAQIVLILLAAIAFLVVGGDQPGLRAGMALVLVAGLMVVVGLLWAQQRGLFSSLLTLAGAFGLKPALLERRRDKILAVDQAITGFYDRHRLRFVASTAFYLGGWLVDTLEIYVVAHLLGMPITWPQALAVEGFAGVAKALGMWVPGSVGVQESGIVLLGRLAGLPDTLSVAYALLRRARELIFAGAGLWLFYAEGMRLRSLRPAAPVPSA